MPATGQPTTSTERTVMIPPAPLVWSLPSDPSAVPLARRKLRAHLARATDSQRDRILLAASELVTNAVLHGVGPVTLRAWLEGGAMRVEVSEDGEGEPLAQRDHDVEDEGGRGLHIVEVVSTRWGVRPDDPRPGKTVWFEVSDQVEPTDVTRSRR